MMSTGILEFSGAAYVSLLNLTVKPYSVHVTVTQATDGHQDCRSSTRNAVLRWASSPAATNDERVAPTTKALWLPQWNERWPPSSLQASSGVCRSAYPV